MKRLFFNLIALLTAVLFFTAPKSICAQEQPRKFWSALIPSHTKLQLAGGTGTVSAGIGWTYGRHDQWETDLMAGYLPKYSSDKNRATITFKQSYIPWHIALGNNGIWKRLSFSPLRCGLYANAILGSGFWTKEPDIYPNKYYKFSTRWRFHIFIGEQFTLHLNGKKSRPNNISFYYELHTYDLMAISAFTNRELDFTDFVKLSLGVKYRFR